jgi:hypothetical protein
MTGLTAHDRDTFRRPPWLYIAGPYSSPDPVANTHVTITVATAVMEDTGYVPVVPHLTMLWHTVTPRPYEWWLVLDQYHLSRCDAILRLPGASSGADAEVELARAWGLDVLSIDDMPSVVADTYHHAYRQAFR